MSSSNPAHVDANPGVRAGETALRAGLEHLTLDILPTALGEQGIPVIVSTGELGAEPIAGEIAPADLAFLLFAADLARPCRVIDTPAWACPAVA